MDFCRYRENKQCNMGGATECKLCLIGMLCDEVGLNTSAIMSMSMDKFENGSERLVKCHPKAVDNYCKDCRHKELHEFKTGCEEPCFFSSSCCERMNKTMEVVHKEEYQ